MSSRCTQIPAMTVETQMPITIPRTIAAPVRQSPIASEAGVAGR
jgi:hypothetical protein